MKKGILSLTFLTFLFSISLVSTLNCNLDTKLISQDPYPAIPGDYVKIVFQVGGVGNPDCGELTFELLEKFPISFDPGMEKSVSVNSGSFNRGFKSVLVAPFKVRVSGDALDGDNLVGVVINSEKNGESSSFIKEFNITVEDVRADFEISVKDYSKTSNEMTFEILNIGESDVEALTIEIERQSNFDIKGSKRNIVGSLDSNEDTTFTFEAIPSDGEIRLMVLYTDETGTRRSLEKNVEFDSSYFEGRVRDQKDTGTGTYVVIIVAIVLGIWWWRAKRKKKLKEKKMSGN
jgi:hypothetical protein